jgi:hypothetical protein
MLVCYNEVARICAAHPNSAFNSDRQLLVQPDLDRRVLLEKLEDKIDGWEQDLASTASSASVHLVGFGLGREPGKGSNGSSGRFTCDIAALVAFSNLRINSCARVGGLLKVLVFLAKIRTLLKFAFIHHHPTYFKV